MAWWIWVLIVVAAWVVLVLIIVAVHHDAVRVRNKPDAPSVHRRR